MPKKKLITLWLVSLDSPEVQAIFDQEENLLSWWFLSDANWRREYFSGIMSKLGYEVVPNRQPKLIKLLTQEVEKY